MQHVEVTDSIIAFQMFTPTGPKPPDPSPSRADTKVIGAVEQKESGSRGYAGLCPKYGGIYHIIQDMSILLLPPIKPQIVSGMWLTMHAVIITNRLNYSLA